MLRSLKLLLPAIAFLAGMMFLPTAGQTRAAQPGWDGHTHYRSAPRAQQRLAPRRKAQRNAVLRNDRRANRAAVYRPRQSAYWVLDHRGRAIPVASPRQKAAHRTQAQRVQAQRVKAQRKWYLARHAQRGNLRPLLRQEAPAQVQRRALPRMASLGNAHLTRFAAPVSGRIEARVDIRSQRMIVSVDGEVRHVWRVSTGKSGFATPRGVYGPKRMHATYFSRKYYNAPMPYSIFFRGGYAVHGTNDLKRLGGPASHGCVRLAVPHARMLFQLVKAYGPGRSRIVIS